MHRGEIQIVINRPLVRTRSRPPRGFSKREFQKNVTTDEAWQYGTGFVEIRSASFVKIAVVVERLLVRPQFVPRNDSRAIVVRRNAVGLPRIRPLRIPVIQL